MERDAIISDCGKYRYLLRRTWDHEKPHALIIMLNPSTADSEVNDATIRSCLRLTKQTGFGSFEVVNIFGLRATNPIALALSDDPKGPMNESVVTAAITRCDTVICAWGAHPMAVQKSNFLVGHIRSRRSVAYCFGKTKSGAPKHPLYIKSGTPLCVF